MKYIIITGNPVDGFEYHGPFGSSDQAVTWAAANPEIDGKDWWVAPLHES